MYVQNYNHKLKLKLKIYRYFAYHIRHIKFTLILDSKRNEK